MHKFIDLLGLVPATLCISFETRKSLESPVQASNAKEVKRADESFLAKLQVATG